MPIAERAPETGIEDIELIDSDIDSLTKKFIEPINRIRSISRPAISQPASKSNNSKTAIIKNDFKGLQISGKALESRAHAFYRMLGFPVVGANNSFYNPGFDPVEHGSATRSLTKENINSSIPKALQTIMNVREFKPEQLRQVFAKQDISSSVYALLLRYPIPFNVLNESSGPFDVDSQFHTVDDRSKEVEKLVNDNPQLKDKINLVAGQFFGVNHILKPFIVDPRIENTVTPDVNKICVPFLLKKISTKINSNAFAQRPGLELILRKRLHNSTIDKKFLKDVENLIANQTAATIDLTSIDRQTLQDTLEALANDNKVSDDSLKIFENFTNIQAKVVSDLVKTIKVVIKKLHQAMITIDVIKVYINWIPLPSVDGPETGPIGASLSKTGANNSISDLDDIIMDLRLKKIDAEREVNELEDLGSFASPFAGSTANHNVKTINDQLQENIQKRDRYAKEAFKAMGVIETITGEISGLGLIDILCIYTALWAIDMKTLVHFLDEDAFQRLWDNNPKFRGVKEVQDRFNSISGPLVSITDVFIEFETKLKNLLSFCDKLASDNLLSPTEVTSGSTE